LACFGQAAFFFQHGGLQGRNGCGDLRGGDDALRQRLLARQLQQALGMGFEQDQVGRGTDLNL
jgi:hypothetical protein